MHGHVETIFVCATGGARMRRVEQAEAVAGAGLRGDRYMQRTGYWTGVDECQVTLIQAEAIEQIEADSGIAVSEGQHRRNIVTRGISLAYLVGRRFHVGEVLLEYDRPRPPCGYIQTVTQKGMTRALGAARGGICARVVVGGTIRPSDAVVVEA